MKNNLDYQCELSDSWGWYIDIEKNYNSIPKYKFTNKKLTYEELNPLEEEKKEINNLFNKLGNYISIIIFSGIIFYVILFVI